jgi:hypothetical protein
MPPLTTEGLAAASDPAAREDDPNFGTRNPERFYLLVLAAGFSFFFFCFSLVESLGLLFFFCFSIPLATVSSFR